MSKGAAKKSDPNSQTTPKPRRGNPLTGSLLRGFEAHHEGNLSLIHI